MTLFKCIQSILTVSLTVSLTPQHLSELEWFCKGRRWGGGDWRAEYDPEVSIKNTVKKNTGYVFDEFQYKDPKHFSTQIPCPVTVETTPSHRIILDYIRFTAVLHWTLSFMIFLVCRIIISVFWRLPPTVLTCWSRILHVAVISVNHRALKTQETHENVGWFVQTKNYWVCKQIQHSRQMEWHRI